MHPAGLPASHLTAGVTRLDAGTQALGTDRYLTTNPATTALPAVHRGAVYMA
jgi:hypothetical protein